MLKKKGRLRPKKIENSKGKTVRKNLKTHKTLRFQVAGRQRLKYCRSLPLGLEMKQLFGRDINRIIPSEMKEKGFVPIISIYRDNDNNNIVLHCSLVEHQDDIVTDENGNARFVRNTDFQK